MRDTGTRYPHPYACGKTGLRFEDDAAKSQYWRDEVICKSVDARRSRYMGFPHDGLPK